MFNITSLMGFITKLYLLQWTPTCLIHRRLQVSHVLSSTPPRQVCNDIQRWVPGHLGLQDMESWNNKSRGIRIIYNLIILYHRNCRWFTAVVSNNLIKWPTNSILRDRKFHGSPDLEDQVHTHFLQTLVSFPTEEKRRPFENKIKTFTLKHCHNFIIIQVKFWSVKSSLL